MHMKNDLESRTSRRKFIRIAAVTGSAGLLSGALVPIRAQEKAAQIALPTTTKEVTPFKVHVPRAALDDLKKRLANTRWPNKEPGSDWSQGVPLAKAQELTEYWRTRYDWRRVESSLNSLPQFGTEMDGLGAYFITVACRDE